MGQDKHEAIKQALVSLLGTENISDDKGIMEAYTRDWLPPGVLDHFPPEFVALPETTEEVQAIYKLANRYSFHCIPVGSPRYFDHQGSRAAATDGSNHRAASPG